MISNLTRPMARRRRALAAAGVTVLAAGLALVPSPVSAQADPAKPDLPPALVPYATATRLPVDLRPATEPGAAAELPGATTDATSPAAPTDRLASTASDVEPFTMIGLSATSASPDDAFVRVHTDDGWGPWEPMTLASDSGPTPGSAEEARSLEVTGGVPVGEPLWVGDADGYEVNLPADAADAAVIVVHDGTREATPEDLAANTTVPTSGQPPISPRTSWGARAPKVAPEVAPSAKFGIVHHSVSTNAYGQSEVPAILRSIQAFHMDGNGWDDIGYNFAVDRYGGMWEARSGGIDRAVIGAHAFEDNYQSSGMVGIGEFDSQGPTGAMLSSFGQLMGWKLQLHGWDVNIPFEGRPAIVGHRDVNQTACPGQLMYNQLGTIRAGAAAKQAEMRATPGFWGAATLNKNPDGRLEVFALRNNNSIWHNWQTGATTWSGWHALLDGVSGRPTVITNADGRLEVFGITTGGAIVHKWQAPGTATGWSGTASLGGEVSPTAGVAAARNPDGRLEIFVIGDNDVLYHLWQWPSSPSGWNGWAPLGEGFPSNAGLTTATNADGRIEVFVTGDGNGIEHAAQAPGTQTGWSALYPIHMPGSGGASVARDADGRLEAASVDDNGVLWHAWQTSPGGVWAAPAPLGAGFDWGSAIKLVADQNGKLQLFGITPNGTLQSMWQTPLTSSGWNGRLTYAGASIAGGVDVGIRSDNRLMVAGMERSGSNVVIATQTVNNGPWSPLIPLF
jgi:hypothetical protein